jgi:hypothetical protein
MRVLQLLSLCAATRVLAHGSHGSGSQKPIVDENANWMTRHMAGTFAAPHGPA